MERLYTVKNFLSIDESSKLLKKFKSELKLKPGKVINNLNNIRKSSVSFIPSIDIIDDKLKEVLKSLIKIKGYEATGLGPYQFSEYKIGEFYDWHIDSSKEEEYRDRYCSIVIQLNDEYDGGYLQLKEENGDNIIQLEKGVGMMHVFYSNIIHRVTPVTVGARYSIVNWISLKKIENFKKTLI